MQMPKDEVEHPFMLSGCKVMDGFGDMMVCFFIKASVFCSYKGVLWSSSRLHKLL